MRILREAEEATGLSIVSVGSYMSVRVADPPDRESYEEFAELVGDRLMNYLLGIIDVEEPTRQT